MPFHGLTKAPRSLILGALLSALATPGAAATVDAARAGVTAAVRGSVSRTPAARPDAVEAMVAGREVFMQDRLRSAKASQAQLLLLDQSSFTVGPNSDLVIDEFVYDPASDSGKLVADVARGTLRFVSGGIGRLGADRITIRTEVSVIGIRGTIALRDEARDAADKLTEETVILAGPGTKNNANAKPGEITVTAAGETVTISRTGWGTIVRPGQPPTEPAPMTAETVQAVNDRLNAGIAAAQQGIAPVPGGVRLGSEESAAGAAGNATAQARTSAASYEDQVGNDVQMSTLITVPNALEQLLTDGLALVEASEITNTVTETVAANTQFTPGLDGASGDEIVNCCFAGSGIFNNLGQEISEFSTIHQLSGGTVSASASGLPLVQASLISDLFTADGAIFISNLSGMAVQGTYNYAFEADLSSKTYSITVSGITADSLGIANGLVSQDTSLPTSGFGQIGFGVFPSTLSTETLTLITTPVVFGSGVSFNGSCALTGCVVFSDLLNVNGNPVAGISHLVSIGGSSSQLVGIKVLGTSIGLSTDGP